MTKPFNLADAKAGHPVSTRDGNIATILKFDSPNQGWPLVGVVGPLDGFCRWTSNGYVGTGIRMENAHDLVMAPIGTIDGKPVYPGDMISAHGKTFPVRRSDEIGKDSKWPRVYPETQMTSAEIHATYGYHGRSCEAVANAAIRHGIDNGYLLDPRETQIMATPEQIEKAIQPSFVMLYKLSQHLKINLSETFPMVLEKLKERERAILRAGIAYAWDEDKQPVHHVDRVVDELIAKVK